MLPKLALDLPPLLFEPLGAGPLLREQLLEAGVGLLDRFGQVAGLRRGVLGALRFVLRDLRLRLGARAPSADRRWRRAGPACRARPRSRRRPWPTARA